MTPDVVYIDEPFPSPRNFPDRVYRLLSDSGPNSALLARPRILVQMRIDSILKLDEIPGWVVRRE